MVSALSNATQSQPVAPFAATSSGKTAQSNSQATTSPTTDTVQLSSAAQAALAAQKEAVESPAQTAREASGGDRQAQRLLAKQVAARIK